MVVRAIYRRRVYPPQLKEGICVPKYLSYRGIKGAIKPVRFFGVRGRLQNTTYIGTAKVYIRHRYILARLVYSKDVTMARTKQKWLEIEELKDGSPNILTSFRRIKEMNEKRISDAGKGKKTRRQYACVFCGRIYNNGYRLMGHLKHCDKRKQFKEMLTRGIEYTVGNKIFHIVCKRIKILKNAETYEKSFAEKIENGTMTPVEAERLFFAFLQGAESSCSKGTIEVRIRSVAATDDTPQKNTDSTPDKKKDK